MTADSPFQGPNLILRAFEPPELPALHEYLNHSGLCGRRYIGEEVSWTMPLSRQQVEQVHAAWASAQDAAHLAVVMKTTGTVIGHVNAEWGWEPHAPSLSVVVSPASQRQGHGSEALDLMLSYLFEHTPAHNVSCWVADWNEAGRLFLRRHGFVENGGMRRAGMHAGRYYDLLVADILRPEWQARPGGPHAA